MLVTRASKKLEFGKAHLHPLTIFMMILGPLVAGVLYYQHQADDTNNIAETAITAVLMASPVIILFITLRVQFHQFAAFGGMKRILLWSMIATGCMLGINEIVGILLPPRQFAITPLDVLLFYIMMASVEETLFRVSILTIMVAILDFTIRVKRNMEPSKRVAIMIAASLVSGATFCLAHLDVYGDVPLMLFSTFAGGTCLAVITLISKDPFPAFVAHVINNAIYAGVTVTNCIFLLVI